MYIKNFMYKNGMCSIVRLRSFCFLFFLKVQKNYCILLDFSCFLCLQVFVSWLSVTQSDLVNNFPRFPTNFAPYCLLNKLGKKKLALHIQILLTFIYDSKSFTQNSQTAETITIIRLLNSINRKILM